MLPFGTVTTARCSVVVCKRRRGCQFARFRRRCGGGPPPSLHWDVEPGRSGSLFFNNQVDPPRSDWTVLDARRWRFANHTNEGEMDAFFLGVKWAGRQHSFRGTILLFLTDSSVALGCIRKGRSSTFRLRRRCQRTKHRK